MRRDPQHITALELDGEAVLHFTWNDGLVTDPEPYALPIVDLLLWQWTGQPTKVRSL